MKPRITLITLGVDDLERSLRFYRDGLGLKTEGIVGTQFEHGAVAFFDLRTGLKLALAEKRHRATPGCLSRLPAPRVPSGQHYPRRRVDAVMAQAQKAARRS
jgi:catechol 2,3-dioxygenase-like lactoylglutathione lyase family enzyme